MKAAILDWFHDWRSAGSHVDEHPPLAVWLVMAVLALAGIAALALEPTQSWRALAVPSAGPGMVVIALLAMWSVQEDAGRLAALVVADLVAATGAAAALAGVFGLDPVDTTRWMTAFAVLQLLVGAYFHGRAWALLLWYLDLDATVRAKASRVAAALASPRNGREFVMDVLSVEGDRIRVELRDGEGVQAAVTTVGALGPKIVARGRYLLAGARVDERPVTGEAAGYRETQRELTALGAESCELVGSGISVSFLPEVVVAVAMLILQHAGIAAAAALVVALV